MKIVNLCDEGDHKIELVPALAQSYKTFYSRNLLIFVIS
jgi:hypothetical protein